MNKNTVWTILGVIGAVVVAWWLVDVLFSVLWFVARLGLVAIVAVGVYFLLRAFFRGSDD
ncbi:hypothetical protein [Microbacterium esteraromaticum]|uniref:hypothetical protein n=1 Tax=Microbacterium esteraromaticum TaxID=57043 RepID=UPI001C9750AA|nr:hypothetical protein [Microbacterium esteraromaticum]MBY6061746.1 hypothetical protein [Microbacterium esteraromaticum]